MRRILFAAVAAACLALPALAVGENQPSEVDPVSCGDGTALDGDHCVTTEQETDESSAEEPSSDELSSDEPSLVPADDEIAADKPRRVQGKKPRFKAAFLNRVWRITGEASGYEAGVLDFTAERFRRLPRRWASQDDAVVGQDTRVLVGSKTLVYDADRDRLSGAAIATALEEAIDVTVTAKILPYAKWQKDDDGITVPTLRAKRIVIVE